MYYIEKNTIFNLLKNYLSFTNYFYTLLSVICRWGGIYSPTAIGTVSRIGELN